MDFTQQNSSKCGQVESPKFCGCHSWKFPNAVRSAKERKAGGRCTEKAKEPRSGREREGERGPHKAVAGRSFR